MGSKRRYKEMPRNHFKVFNELVSIAFLKGPVNQEKIGESGGF